MIIIIYKEVQFINKNLNQKYHTINLWKLKPKQGLDTLLF